ncbi:MAG: glycosyltransferase family 2 protein [Chloroflexi bacterium]|nr:glycosyltransferase family 2 protein [Chloroflexota bacterium]
MKTPLALFVYNRPDHLRQTLEALTRCTRLEECDVYIFCDASKQEAQRPKVDAARRVAREYEKILRATLVERETNVGLARSIVGETTNLCERYGRAIILEDDLIVSPNFINFMLSGLDRYEHDERVYQIAGYLFPITYQLKQDAFFMPLTTSWGWATWRRAWRTFEWQPAGLLELLNDDLLRAQFDLDNSFPYSKMLRARLKGENDSWAILWWYIVFKRGGLVLYPKQSLVWNMGLDGSGTHGAKKEDTPQALKPVTTQTVSQVALPNDVMADRQALAKVKAVLQTRHGLNRSRVRQWLDRLKRL